MKYEPEDAWKWRLRAANLRARVNSSRDPRTRQVFALLADAWEEKADKVAAVAGALAAAQPNKKAT